MSEAQSPTEDAALHGMLQFTGKSIRLRHAVTGLFLSVRPAQEEDTATLKMNSSRTVMRLKAERKQKDLLTLQGEGRGSNSALANSPSGQKRRATAASMIEEERDFVANAVSSASGFDLLAESKNEQDMPETFDVLESASSASANEEERAAASRRPSAASLAEGEGGKLECHDISNDNDNNNSQYAGGVVAGRKGSTIQILHFADDSATGPDKVTIFIRSIYVAGMKNVNWAGKHFSGVHLRFGAKELCSDRDWQYRTVVSDRAGNTARWDMHKADRSVQFLVAEDECSHNVMEVKGNSTFS